MSLFDGGAGSDRAYEALRTRDSQGAREARLVLDKMYERVAPYLDSDLQAKIRIQFCACQWEICLAVALLDAGISLVPRLEREPRAKGPDLLGNVDGKRFWFEAVAVGRGTGEDRVKEMEGCCSHLVQEEGVMLRILSALREKFGKYQTYLQEKWFSVNDGFIIALNASQIGTDAYLEVTIPYIVRSVLPYGHEVAHWDMQAMKVVAYSHEHCDRLVKESGSLVEKRMFQDQRFSGISAVMYSVLDVLGHRECCPDRALVPGESFITVHNPLALVPLPWGTLKQGDEYRVQKGSMDTDELFRHPWRSNP